MHVFLKTISSLAVFCLFFLAPDLRIHADESSPETASGVATKSQTQELAAQDSSGAFIMPAPKSRTPWWIWPLLLFVVCFLLGIVAVLGGVGGGVLFVPIVGSFFPFHMDFVRATGLLLALSGALASSPMLFRKGMTNLRVAMPFSLVASCSAIVGAMLGMAIPERMVQLSLGIIILFIVVIMLLARKTEYPRVENPDRLSNLLRINGSYLEESTGHEVDWKTHRSVLSGILFVFIGFIGGMFGLGAGWANVPVLNMVSGVPLKVAVATSSYILLTSSSAAAWVYINKGALIAMIAIPSIIGIMLGAKIGVKLLKKTRPENVRKIVIVLLVVASVRALLKGLGIWN